MVFSNQDNDDCNAVFQDLHSLSETKMFYSRRKCPIQDQNTLSKTGLLFQDQNNLSNKEMFYDIRNQRCFIPKENALSITKNALSNATP